MSEFKSSNCPTRQTRFAAVPPGQPVGGVAHEVKPLEVPPQDCNFTAAKQKGTQQSDGHRQDGDTWAVESARLPPRFPLQPQRTLSEVLVDWSVRLLLGMGKAAFFLLFLSVWSLNWISGSLLMVLHRKGSTEGSSQHEPPLMHESSNPAGDNRSEPFQIGLL